MNSINLQLKHNIEDIEGLEEKWGQLRLCEEELFTIVVGDDFPEEEMIKER